MLSERGDYRDWTEIAYRPAIAAHYPDALLADLKSRAVVLDVGCHDGIVSCHIARARRDVTVHGIDINPDAIAAARERAVQERIDNTTFAVADILRFDKPAAYDALVTIRVLTCFSNRRQWIALVTRIHRLLKPGGRWYVVDYVQDETNPAYRGRYEAAARKGWRRGNFTVNDSAGNALFIAHHHFEEEIECLSHLYRDVRLRRFESRSMNGNRATMFEFLGRRGDSKR